MQTKKHFRLASLSNEVFNHFYSDEENALGEKVSALAVRCYISVSAPQSFATTGLAVVFLVDHPKHTIIQ